jgi:hypothetical protein
MPELAGETVPVEFAGFTALMVRSYFLKGLRHIDERYGQSWADAELAAQIRRASKRTALAPGARAVVYPREERKLPAAALALFAADWVNGAAVYAGKHFGLAAGWKIRVVSALRAVGALLTLRQFRYNWSRVTFLVSGRKLDGTQGPM